MIRHTPISKSTRHVVINNGNKLLSIFLLFLLLFACSPDEGQSNDILLACGVNGEFNSETQQCDCTAGWEGELCDKLIEDCTINPCESGTCDEATGACICDAWHWGTFCEKEVVTFEKTFEGVDSQSGRSVLQTSDGGFIIVGSDRSLESDIYVLKVDALGNEEWNKSIGENRNDYVGGVLETEDGHFMIGGSFGQDSGERYAHLIKLDASGQLIWNYSYEESNNNHHINDIKETEDGGFMMIGNSYVNMDSEGESDVYMLKVDVEGQKEWSNMIGWLGYDEGVSFDKTENGGYIITGRTYSFGNASIFLLKIDDSGAEEWHQILGIERNCEAFAVEQTNDGGFIVVGHVYGLGNGLADVYLIKTDDLGNEQWFATFGGSDVDYGKSVEQTLDGGYIVCGMMKGDVSGNREDVYLIKTDANGGEEWTRTFGGSFIDEGLDAQQTMDGGYIITGRYRESIDSYSDVYLIKTNADGNL